MTPSKKKKEKENEPVVLPFKRRNRMSHRVGKLPKDGGEGSMRRSSLLNLIQEKRTYGDSIQILGEEIRIQDAIAIGNNSNLLLESEVEKSDLAGMREQMKLMVRQIGELQATASHQTKEIERLSRNCERLNIYYERGQSVTIRAFIRAPIEAVMKDTKENLQIVNKRLEESEYIGEVLDLGGWEVVVDRQLERFMKISQAVANTLSVGVHSATPIEVAAVLEAPMLRIPQPMTRQELVNEFKTFFGLCPVEVLQRHKDGTLEAKFSRGM